MIKKTEEISTFRRILPQILASSAKNLLLLDLGMSVAFPTILIPSLKGLKPHDNNDFLSFTDVQASWFGKYRTQINFSVPIKSMSMSLWDFFNVHFHAASIAFIFQPIGSVASGIVLEPLGRKRSMILVNIPHIIGWLLLHNASSVTQLYIAGKLLLTLHHRKVNVIHYPLLIISLLCSFL